MITLIEYFQFAFVQRALIAGVLLALLTGVFGVITLMRKAAFYGDAVAHSSLAGVALGLVFGWYPLLTALLYAIGVASILPWLRKQFRLSLDAVLGIVLPTSMGLGVLIFSLLPGYQPEMISFLFGSMVTIRWQDLALLTALFVVSVVVFIWYLPRLLFLSLDREYAQVLKIRVSIFERLYEILLAATIIAGVKLVGVVLINALLVIPASTAKLHAQSLKQWVFFSTLYSLAIVVGGLVLALLLNTPPGATMAVFAGGVFVSVGLLRKITA